MPSVFVVGSVNADVTLPVAALPAPGATVLATGDPAHAGGGKGANVAVAAARDGARVHLVAAVGDDAAGRAALDELRGEGVDTAGVAVLPDRATGLAMICVDAAGENTIVVAAGANGALDAEAVAAGLDDVAADDVVVVSFEIPDAAVEAAAHVAAARGARLVANPSPVRALPPDLCAAAPLLVANAGEVDALENIGEGGLVTTLGADGAKVAGGPHVRAPHVHVVDTTGAGDTFTGILVGALARGRALADAVTRATVGAGLSTEARGARGGMPRTAAIDAAVASP